MRLPKGEAAWERAFDGLQSFGLSLLFVALPLSEALKSVALALTALGFAGRLAAGGRCRGAGRGVLAALLAHVAAAAISVAAARAPMRHPGELFTLGMTVMVFPITADACSRATRKSLFAVAILAGAAAAALSGYVEYMAGDALRLSLPSVENPVPAGEYLAAAAAFGLPLLAAELAAPLGGPLVAFTLGSLWLALLMTKSRGPLLGGAAGSFAGASFSGGRRLSAALTVAAAAAVVLFTVAHPTARVLEMGGSRAAFSRTATWRATVELIRQRPLIGHGPGSYPDLRVVYRDEVGSIHQLNAHNIVLQSACDTGILGSGTLVLFVVLGIRGIVMALRASQPGRPRAVSAGALAAVAALLASGAFSVSIDAEPGMLLFALLGLGGGATPPDR